MDIVDVNSRAYRETVLDDSQQTASESVCNNSAEQSDCRNQETKCSNNEGVEKHSAVWTTNATSQLLELYEAKLELLETPKKKTRIWIAISENLKEYNIEMTPDQVRWKINALAKKYKQCIDCGKREKFKYFKEMDHIYSHYNVDCDSYTIQNAEVLQKKKNSLKNQVSAEVNESGSSQRSIPESRKMIELRKIRLANRIESDRSQSKINLEKQWLVYLKQQEEQMKLKDEIHERNLRIREEELELKKRELEMKESLELRRIEQRERDQEEIFQIEREKCEVMKNIFAQQLNRYN